jgi:DNA repair protein RAD16
MSHFCWWNREILRNILKYGHEGPGREAFDNLRKLLT